MYDHTGVMGFTYQGQTYFYQKDLQGNIVTIVNAAGAPVAQYYYDAWGNHKVYDGDYITEMTSPTFIGNLNPFRYRGYYYDSETGLYYLKSRYYDPEVGRFISADATDYVEYSQFNGLNIYAYCNNNPMLYVDSSGNYATTAAFSVGAIFIFLIAALAVYIEATLHPVEKLVDGISDCISNVEFNPSVVKEDKRDNVVFSKSRGGGRETDFAGLNIDQLEKMLDDAKRKGDKKLVSRINKELKNRGKRNKRKRRGGPVMRGVSLLWLLRRLFDDNSCEEY